MAHSNRPHLTIDLNQFKLRMSLPDRNPFTLHFDTPSRRFYLSVIALVVEQMRRCNPDATVPLKDHAEVLALLNETVGNGAGSSNWSKLIGRIYRKWKEALPNLEGAPLFNVIGCKKEFDEGAGKAYRFEEKTKDSWANLFEYKGSRENMRLRFSVERLGIALDDVAIVYGTSSETPEGKAWDRFLQELREKNENLQPAAPADEHDRDNIVSEQVDAPENSQKPQKKKWKKAGFVLSCAFLLLMATAAFWNFYSKPELSTDTVVSETPDFPELAFKKSIAVLPFVNIAGDPGEDYLSDGITEQIITALSKAPRLLVIARSSVFTYKGKPVEVQKVGKELGVSYVLEGSVQRSGDRLRITAQLIDARTGNHLWAEKYDRQLEDIFQLQDDITIRVLKAVQVELTEGEQARIYGKGTNNLEAYLALLRGREHIHLHNQKDNQIAKQLFEQAIILDSTYGPAYQFLASSHLMDVVFGWSKSPEKSIQQAFDLSRKLLTLDSTGSGVHQVLAYLYSVRKEYAKAISEAEKAIEVQPGDADGYAFLGLALSDSGRHKKAIPALKKAISLNPIPPSWYLMYLGWACFYTGQLDEAISTIRRLTVRDTTHANAHAAMGCALLCAGKPDEAIVEFDRALELNPDPAWYNGNRAIALVGIGKGKDAIASMQDLIGRKPHDPDAYRYFSNALRLEGRYQEAFQMAQTAESLRHGAFDLLHLGISFFMLGQYEEAIAILKKAIQICPDCLMAHLWLAAACSQSRRMEEARAEISEVHRINPEFSLNDVMKNGYTNHRQADKERFMNALKEAGLR